MFDIGECLKKLGEERPVFHSEADFQHAMAWKIQQTYPSATIRLEVPYSIGDGRQHIDIVVKLGGQRYAIELKYKTKGGEIDTNGERFRLVHQGAYNLVCYDFWKDVERVGRHGGGYAIFLTNDTTFFSQKEKVGDSANYVEFKLCNGRNVRGKLRWKRKAGSTRRREAALNVYGPYKLEWKPYSTLGFHYLLLKVGKV